jgi:DNA modification methylase
MSALPETWTVQEGDCLELLRGLPDGCVNCCVTSPPYWSLRDYGVSGQYGLEPTLDEYVAGMAAVFGEVRRVLRDDGTAWVNLGDSYTSGDRQGHGTRAGYKQQTNRGMNGDADPPRCATPDGLKQKDLCGIPWRVAFALQADGWYLRSDIIWAKPNPMPESVTDRPTRSHEYVFLLTKSARYWYDADAIREPLADGTPGRLGQPGLDSQRGGFKTEEYQANHPGRKQVDNSPADILRHMRDSGMSSRNKRDVWQIATQPYPEAHFATYPEALVRPCIRAGCPPDGLVLDPFAGSGTTGLVAVQEGRRFLGMELNPEYAAMARRRIGMAQMPLALEEAAQ